MNDTENAGGPPAPERKTIQSVAEAAIREGLTNEQALERVLADFPYARTTKASIGKYRRMMRDAGEDVPKRKTVRSVAEAAIREGLTNGEALERVLAEFPHARTTTEAISQYRRMMRSAGEDVPKRKTVRSVAEAAIREGLSNGEAVERVLAEFPHARTTTDAISQFRRMMRRAGEDVPKRKTVRSVAEAAIREGLTNGEALERVLAEFPHARTTTASISKFRRMMRRAGEDLPTPKRKTPGSLALEPLREGKTTRQVIEAVKAEFPKARMTASMVSSYRNRLRGRGEVVPTAREATAAASARFDRLAADLEAAEAAHAAMKTKADRAAMKTRLAWCIAGAAVAAVVAGAVAVKLLF